jgi:hypothetical protein
MKVGLQQKGISNLGDKITGLAPGREFEQMGPFPIAGRDQLGSHRAREIRPRPYAGAESGPVARPLRA